jgi:hypothetical protein
MKKRGASRIELSFGKWCDACCGALRPIWILSSHPAILSVRGGGSLRRSRESLQVSGRGEARRQPAAARVQGRGAGPRSARQRGPALDARARGRDLVSTRERAVAAGRPAAPACLLLMRASQPRPAQLLRGVRNPTESGIDPQAPSPRGIRVSRDYRAFAGPKFDVSRDYRAFSDPKRGPEEESLRPSFGRERKSLSLSVDLRLDDSVDQAQRHW